MLTTKILNSNDINLVFQLINLYKKVFEIKEDIPTEEYLSSFINKPNVIIGVVIMDNKVLGGYTAYILPSIYRDIPDIYLYDLAVDSDYQGQGLGKNLIQSLKEYAKSISARSMYCHTDVDSIQANEFYQRRGFYLVNVQEYRIEV